MLATDATHHVSLGSLTFIPTPEPLSTLGGCTLTHGLSSSSSPIRPSQLAAASADGPAAAWAPPSASIRHCPAAVCCRVEPLERWLLIGFLYDIYDLGYDPFIYS